MSGPAAAARPVVWYEVLEAGRLELVVHCAACKGFVYAQHIATASDPVEVADAWIPAWRAHTCAGAGAA